METLGQRFAKVRKDKGLSLQEVAEKAGLKFQNISRIETGSRGGDVRAATLKKLCEALPVSSDYLLGLTEDPAPATGRPPRTPRAPRRGQGGGEGFLPGIS